MSFGDKQSDPHHGVAPDLVEHPGRVPVTEEPSPAAEESVDLRHDLFDRCDKPGPHCEEADAVSGVLHRALGGPAGKEHDAVGASTWCRTHEPMVKAEEVEPRPTFDELHDPR